MIKLRSTLLLAFSIAPMALAQDGSIVVGGGAQPTTVPAQTQPTFESLAKPGPDGKIIRLDGIVDLLALQKNSLIDQATRDRIRPMIKEWMADVDQIAIDNLDFIEQIEPLDGTPGIIDRFDIRETDKLTTVGQIMTHLMSAGPLSSYLETKGGLTREQSQLNQQIGSDYLQKVMNEIMADNGVPNALEQAPKTEEEKTHQVNTVSKFLYGLSCRDAVESYHRLLVQTAPNIDKVIASMKVNVDPAAVAKAKSARSNEERRAAVRAIVKGLTFDQRREVLDKGRELAGDFDPLSIETASAHR
jgi:hypothetical protein